MSNKSKRIIVGCVATVVMVSSLFAVNIVTNAKSNIVTTTITKVAETEQPTSSTTVVASSSTTKGTVETTEKTTKVVTTTKKATNTTPAEKETKTNKKKTTYKETTKKKAKKKKKNGNSYKIKCKITHYCSCATCNGSSSGLTAMGTKLKPYYTVAVDRSVIPLGSTVVINGQEYRAEDTGVSGNTIDMCVSSHSEAYDKGVYYTTVTVYP